MYVNLQNFEKILSGEKLSDKAKEEINALIEEVKERRAKTYDFLQRISYFETRFVMSQDK